MLPPFASGGRKIAQLSHQACELLKNALSLKQAVLTQADRADRLVTAGGSDTSFNGKGLLA